MEYQRDEHRVHLILDHLVWTRTRRKAVLKDAIAVDGRRLMEQTCAEQGWEIVERAIHPDHIHRFVRVWPSVAAADVVKEVKGLTAHERRERYAVLRNRPSRWTHSSFFAATVGNVSNETVRRYLAAQKERSLLERKAVRYRLYPSRVQERLLDATLETCRRFYNDCLAERKQAGDDAQRTVGKVEHLRQVKKRKATNPWAKDVHSHVLQIVGDDLDNAFHAFFRRLKAGKKPGYPRCKGRHRWHSFGFKEYGNGFRLDGRRLKLSGIGRIAVRWHRPIEGQIKTLRISKQAGKWYASFSCVGDEPTPLPATGKDGGMDVGRASLMTTSAGEQVAHPRFYRQAQRKLRVCQRRVARRKKGGQNRRKAVVMLQRQHERIRNQRKDDLNTRAHDLVKRDDRIALEDRTITRMVHGNRAQRMLDAGWGSLVQRLTHKAASAGRIVVLVDPRQTSKRCSSGCGHVFETLSFADRWVDCPRCGLSLDSDHNAAINILNRGGQLRWSLRSPEGGLGQEAARL